MFTDDNILNISDRITKQFPEFYQEYGPGLIEFVRVYYQWLESGDRPISNIRNLYSQYDIDTVSQQFLDHYKQKYIYGLPREILGNQRLLQKHIVELYRSKGSQQGVRLLFRLLFNEDIDFYIPSYDIFKLSDNTWVQPHYIEVTYSKYFDKLIGATVTGEQSHASAVVESYQKRYSNKLTAYTIMISNITGSFKCGERLLTDNINPIDMPNVLGSVVSVDVIGSSSGAQIGDQLSEVSSDNPVVVVVSDIYDNDTGALNFSIIKPGCYYSLGATFKAYPGVHEDMLQPVVNSDINSTYPFPKNDKSNTETIIDDSLYGPRDNIIPDNIPISGEGADIKILAIKDTILYQYTRDVIHDYLDTRLDQKFNFPHKPDADINSKIEDSLTYDVIEVGAIDKIQILNPGANYSSNVYFVPIDPYTSLSGIKDSEGNYVGRNGLIVGSPINGENLIKSVDVLSSGYNNIDNQYMSFASDDKNITMSGRVNVGGVGFDRGYYSDSKSFLSDDKYLFDGHYYQDFSYVIRASRTLDKYVDILKQLVHSAGNAVYGDIFVAVNDKSPHSGDGRLVKHRDFRGFSKGFSKGFG